MRCDDEGEEEETHTDTYTETDTHDIDTHTHRQTDRHRQRSALTSAIAREIPDGARRIGSGLVIYSYIHTWREGGRKERDADKTRQDNNKE
jgi:hypothetical protein